MDSDHAALVNRVVATLRTDGWEVIVEYTFNHYGDRGSVDVIAWHAGERSLFIIEVKSRLLDMQETLAALGRKTRVVPGLLARERGWHPAYLGVALVMSSLTANRAAVARNGATFDATFPQRTVDARRWVRRPSGPLAALWFVSSSNGITGTRAPGSRKRVRRSSSRSASRAVSA